MSYSNNNNNILRQQQPPQFSHVVMGNDSCRSSTVYNNSNINRNNINSATLSRRLLRP